jgi:hypothetical protein
MAAALLSGRSESRSGRRPRSLQWSQSAHQTQAPVIPPSFHLALLDPTEAHWLDDASDLSCKEPTGQHAGDGCPLWTAAPAS